MNYWSGEAYNFQRWSQTLTQELIKLAKEIVVLEVININRKNELNSLIEDLKEAQVNSRKLLIYCPPTSDYRGMSKIWAWLDEHSPFLDEHFLTGWFLTIFAVIMGLGIIGPYIGIGFGIIAAIFIMLWMLAKQYPIIMMIAAVISVILLVKSYNRYKRDKKEKHERQEI